MHVEIRPTKILAIPLAKNLIRLPTPRMKCVEDTNLVLWINFYRFPNLIPCKSNILGQQLNPALIQICFYNLYLVSCGKGKGI